MENTPRQVSRPAKALPPGACDSHAHVFGPFERFPLHPARSYEPPLAPAEHYLAMLDRVGTTHGVLVHPSASGWDCSCTLNALAMAPHRLRGVVVVEPDIGDRALGDMQSAGVRGIRFTEAGDSRQARLAGALGLRDLPHFATRLRELQWHAQLWAKCGTLVAAAPALLRHDLPLVIDHMGFFDSLLGVEAAIFREFLGLLHHENIWVKLSLCRISRHYPYYADARPFHDALLRVAPERMLWGSDWPYINLDPGPPDVGCMIDAFDAFVADEQLRQQVFVENASRLYGF